MIQLLNHIIWGFVLSFIGSLPLGTISAITTDTAVKNGLLAAIWVALGASMVEFFQAMLALQLSHELSSNPQIKPWLVLISIPILIILSIYLFYQARKPVPIQVKPISYGKGFLKGALVSLVNVLAIPYWVFYGSYLVGMELISLEKLEHHAGFSLGVSLGTFIVLYLYARLGDWLRKYSKRITQYVNLFMAAVLLLLAIYQIIDYSRLI